MSKWQKAAEKSRASSEKSGDLTPHVTMNLRRVVLRDSTFTFEQMVEYRNNSGMVVKTDWVEIPTLYEG